MSIIGVMIYYGSENNPFSADNPSVQTSSTKNQKLSYDPPMYLCRLVKVVIQGIEKNLPDAGITFNWITVATKNGPPPPTRDDPTKLSIDGMSDNGNDLDANIGYFFDLCLGPYSDNLALCDGVRAQSLMMHAVNLKQNDCRIAVRMK